MTVILTDEHLMIDVERWIRSARKDYNGVNITKIKILFSRNIP
tara:strand:+ start:2034 stop:2162 length:129 start_codon:yes stop_codon:yes gene_type:complete